MHFTLVILGFFFNVHCLLRFLLWTTIFFLYVCSSFFLILVVPYMFWLLILYFMFFVVQSLSRIWLFATLWTAAHQASLSFTVSQNLLRLMSIESVIPSKHLIPCLPLLLLPSIFPSIRVFSNELAVCIKWSNTGSLVSASVLPMNIQSWFPLGLTDLIFLLSKGLSGVFSSTTLWKHQFLALTLLYGPTFKSVHDYWKNYSFDYTDLCQQSDVSAF